MTTINKEEIQKFSSLAEEWWDVNGKFKPLHMFNPVRIEYILDIVCSHFNLDRKKNLPLKKLKILDIGCGGGLISEPMCRLGAEVTATIRFVAFPGSTLSNFTPSISSTISDMILIFSSSLPSEMFGTHSIICFILSVL